MKKFLRSLFFTLGIPFLLVGLLSAIIFYFASRLEQQEKDVVALNNGYGSAANPLPASRLIRFETLSLRLTRYINPVTDELQDISGLNPDPAMKYILLWLEGECDKEMCHGSEAQFSLIDRQGNKYAALSDVVLNEFSADSARYGNDLKGWLLFEMPYDSDPTLLEIIYDRVALYGYMGELTE